MKYQVLAVLAVALLSALAPVAVSALEASPGACAYCLSNNSFDPVMYPEGCVDQSCFRPQSVVARVLLGGEVKDYRICMYEVLWHEGGASRPQQRYCVTTLATCPGITFCCSGAYSRADHEAMASAFQDAEGRAVPTTVETFQEPYVPNP